MTYDALLRSFADEINSLADRGALTWDWFLNGSWNQNSWLHALMFGALVRSVTLPYIPMVEVKWGQGFRPDLCVLDQQCKHEIGVIEYESTNSSDERLMCKDLKHFEVAILNYAAPSYKFTIPQWWLLISSLPNQSVKRWPFYDWSYEENTPSPKDKQRRDANPLLYFEQSVHDCMLRVRNVIESGFAGRMPTEIVWANIDGHALTVLNINGKKQDGRTTFVLHLKDKAD
jgi:hypothetical protein